LVGPAEDGGGKRGPRAADQAGVCGGIEDVAAEDTGELAADAGIVGDFTGDVDGVAAFVFGQAYHLP